jgi:NADPH:quinone reductase-like Zn-dependent oxidoreductase
LVKAYRLNDFSGLEDLKLRDEDAPRPQRGEVLIRVHAVSLNFRGIAMLRGRSHASSARDWSPRATGPTMGFDILPDYGVFDIFKNPDISRALDDYKRHLEKHCL